MNVDEVIPGFGRNTSSENDRSWSSKNNGSLRPDMSLPRSASALERSFSVEREKGPSIPSQSLENLPVRSRSDGAPYLARHHEPDSRRSSSTPQPTAPIPRRGTKRPVAADFDTEPVAKSYTPLGPSRTGSGTGFSNGIAYHPNPHVRRKLNGAATGGFASLNSARRCVIDVSDSEDDASEDEFPSRGPQPQGELNNSALALELEIERMRKIIREREENKLRKQAVRGYQDCISEHRLSHTGDNDAQMVSSRSTPVSVSRESPTVSRAFEEETSEMSASSATKDEIPRSESSNDKASENGAFLF
jgi:hypothetical protein